MSDLSGEGAAEQIPLSAGPGAAAIYFDGRSSRRHLVTLKFRERLELDELDQPRVAWSYEDIRRADSPSGILRLSCLSALGLARLEIRDAGLASEVIARCPRIDENRPGGHAFTIVGWSLAAAASILAMVWFGVPLVAERLTPLVPPAFERRLGDVADSQIKVIFGNKICNNPAGQAAFTKLVTTLREAAGLDPSVRSAVLSTAVPNAFALPGGRVYLFDGLLAKAQNPDEIAGVLAHEFGHLKHRDGTRNLIHNGGTSFLIGLLFGDVTGSGAMIFASRSLLTASYSREAEQSADDFSIEMMHKLGRPTKPMGELLFRVTGKQGDHSLTILTGHPLTEDRLQHMTEASRAASGPPLLTADEWQSLKTICTPATLLDKSGPAAKSGGPVSGNSGPPASSIPGNSGAPGSSGGKTSGSNGAGGNNDVIGPNNDGVGNSGGKVSGKKGEDI
jgi:Zn-dependent protease with chaperone function